MQQAIPLTSLVDLIELHALKTSTGRSSFDIEPLLHIHFLQQWFNLSDPGSEEALHETPLFQHFCNIDTGLERIPDESRTSLPMQAIKAEKQQKTVPNSACFGEFNAP